MNNAKMIGRIGNRGFSDKVIAKKLNFES